MNDPPDPEVRADVDVDQADAELERVTVAHAQALQQAEARRLMSDARLPSCSAGALQKRVPAAEVCFRRLVVLTDSLDDDQFALELS